MQDVLLFDLTTSDDLYDYEIKPYDEMSPYTRGLYDDEAPVSWFTGQSLRAFFNCKRGCPAYPKKLYNFTFSNTPPHEGIQLSSVVDATLSLDNSMLMFPYAKDHDHELNDNALSDVPPFSLAKLDFSRPIVAIDECETMVVVHVRDPFLTGAEIYDYCIFGTIPDRYAGTGYDRERKAYPFNLSYLEMVERQIEIKDDVLCWGRNGRKYANGANFKWDRRYELPIYAGEHLFTYKHFDDALKKMEYRLDRRYFDGFALALHEHLYNARYTAAHASDRWAKKKVWTSIRSEWAPTVGRKIDAKLRGYDDEREDTVEDLEEDLEQDMDTRVVMRRRIH